jgi:hypothetical protein
MKRIYTLIALLVFAATFSIATFAQNGTNSGSGRIASIAVDPSDPSGNTYYVGSANGGVWKTTDGGTSWVVQIALIGVPLLAR